MCVVRYFLIEMCVSVLFARVDPKGERTLSNTNGDHSITQLGQDGRGMTVRDRSKILREVLWSVLVAVHVHH